MPKRKSSKLAHRPFSYPVRFLFAFLVALTVFVIGLYIQRTATTIYTGTLPCADCIGIKTQLVLHGNNTYEWQSIYIDKGTPYTEKGMWQQEEKNNMQVYVLRSRALISYFEILNSNTLKMLDTYGRPINAPFAMTLKKQ